MSSGRERESPRPASRGATRAREASAAREAAGASEAGAAPEASAARAAPILTTAAAVWVLLVAAIELFGLGLSPAELGSSPDTLVRGEVWHLFTSSLLVDGEVPLLQLALVAAVTTAVILRHGAGVWWAAALLGHVGSALIAYAAIGIATALGNHAADAISDDWDYGVSCVMAAQFGVLFAGAIVNLRGDGRRDPLDLLFVATACIAMAFYLATLDWYGIEHPLAFGIGAAVLVVAQRRAAQR